MQNERLEQIREYREACRAGEDMPDVKYAHEAIDYLLDQIQAAQAGGWVSVADRLPVGNEIHPRTGHGATKWLLVASKVDKRLAVHAEPHYMRLSDKQWFGLNSSFATPHVTHWMPLPTPPNG